MLRALGVEPPLYAHVPMILGPDGAKLSKRHGAVSCLQYRDDGFLPEGLLNYLGRLGWSHGDQEIFTLEEMTRLFDIHDVNKGASALNLDKMLWTNQQHIMRATPERLAQYLRPQLAMIGIETDDMAKLAAVAKSQQERAKTLKEMAANSTFFFRDVTAYDEKAAKKNLTAEAAPLLQQVRDRMAMLADWNAAELHKLVQAVAEEGAVGLGKVAQPIRVAVSGGTVSPPIDVTLEILGREVALQRLDRAIAACI
jgi:glutamyl-tRNA synthetase